ncbi:MAG: D-aminoacyl-tRNA deacylase [Anaerovoracaceae bacterium]|nr:D-tyrosyl-tRNA(Tyr) deacylase [Clostridiales bacterium]
MRAVVQRAGKSRVTVKGQVTGEIEKGFVVLLGVGKEDNEEDALYLARKIANLRIFEDSMGKMNLSINEIGGEILCVSQFTLYADTRKGNRPSFVDAALPDDARALYHVFTEFLRHEGLKVEEGVFKEDMKVELINDGPVTIIIDSRKTD